MRMQTACRVHYALCEMKWAATVD